MIWWWLWQMGVWLARLFVPPPLEARARVSADSRCPACGGLAGRIRCVKRGPSVILVQHTCGTCGARWHEQPVVNVDASMVWPSVPRNEQEMKEELNASGLRADAAMGRAPQPVKPVEVRHPPNWSAGPMDTGRVEIQPVPSPESAPLGRVGLQNMVKEVMDNARPNPVQSEETKEEPKNGRQ